MYNTQHKHPRGNLPVACQKLAIPLLGQGCVLEKLFSVQTSRNNGFNLGGQATTCSCGQLPQLQAGPLGPPHSLSQEAVARHPCIHSRPPVT